MMLLDVVRGSWLRNRLVAAPLMLHMILRSGTRATHTGAMWTAPGIGTLCSRTFSGVVLVQGAMLLQLYWNPYIWIRAPTIPFGIWTASTLVHFGQLVGRAVFATSDSQIAAAASGLGGGLTAPRLSKKRMLLEILWLGMGACVNYLLTGGWAERQELHRATANLKLMLTRIQDMKLRTRLQLQAGMEPSIGLEQLEGCRQEVRIYIRRTQGYFPEVVEAAEAIYLELTEAMGLIKMAREADARRRKDGEGRVAAGGAGGVLA